jgi:FkbM family methyltransferase
MGSTPHRTLDRAARQARTALNYAYFRWHTRHAPPSGFFLEIYKALNYSRASIRFMEDAAKAPPGEGVYASAGLLLQCALGPEDVILDVGAYIGDWAAQMRSRYDARVHAFEPNPELFATLRAQFAGDPKVVAHPYGLAAKNTIGYMSLAGMGSSVYSDSPVEHGNTAHEKIALRDVKDVFDELDVREVGLLKVNIEGGEYDFLERLIDCGLQARCRCIRVQFHEWYEGSHALRKRLVTALGRTHDVEWSYPFVWESWRRRP